MSDLSERERIILDYMIESNMWQSATRIGMKAGGITYSDAYKWSTNSLRGLVKRGYVSHSVKSGSYRIKPHVVVHHVRKKTGKAEMIIDHFLYRLKGNNNPYTATR